MDRIRALSLVGDETDGFSRSARFASALRQRGFQTDLIYTTRINRFSMVDLPDASSQHMRIFQTGGSAHLVSLRWQHFLHRLVNRLPLNLRVGAKLRCKGLSPFATALRREALHQPASLYIAHSVSALPGAVSACRRYGGVLVYDADNNYAGMFRDADHPDNTFRAQIEQAYAKEAALITTRSPVTSQSYTGRFPDIPVVTVLDAPIISKLPTSGVQQSMLRFFWQSQTIGEYDGLKCFLDAWQKLENQNISLTLVGEWQPGFKTELMAYAQKLNLPASQIHHLDPMSKDALQNCAGGHDIGLTLVDSSLCANADEIVSETLFTYLHAGLFSLASETSGLKSIKEIWGAAGLTHSFGNSDQLAAQIRALQDNPQVLKAGKAAARALAASQFHWLVESRKLLAGIRNAIAENLRR